MKIALAAKQLRSLNDMKKLCLLLLMFILLSCEANSQEDGLPAFDVSQFFEGKIDKAANEIQARVAVPIKEKDGSLQNVTVGRDHICNIWFLPDRVGISRDRRTSEFSGVTFHSKNTVVTVRPAIQEGFSYGDFSQMAHKSPLLEKLRVWIGDEWQGKFNDAIKKLDGMRKNDFYELILGSSISRINNADSEAMAIQQAILLCLRIDVVTARDFFYIYEKDDYELSVYLRDSSTSDTMILYGCYFDQGVGMWDIFVTLRDPPKNGDELDRIVGALTSM